MAKRSRRHLSPERKAELIRLHVADKVPVSQICDENDLQPSVFYGWLKQLLANAPVALAAGKTSRRARGREAALEDKIEKLESKLSTKNEVIAELSEELLAEKKSAGDL